MINLIFTSFSRLKNLFTIVCRKAELKFTSKLLLHGSLQYACIPTRYHVADVLYHTLTLDITILFLPGHRSSHRNEAQVQVNKVVLEQESTLAVADHFCATEILLPYCHLPDCIWLFDRYDVFEEA